MNKKTVFFLLMTLLSAPFLFTMNKKVDKAETFQDLQGPFMGRKAPQLKAGIFVDGLISTLDDAEMNAAFTQNGKEFYYCAQYQGKWSIFVTRARKNGWSKPVPMSFTAGYTDRDFTMSPDGSSIYFGSNRPREKGNPAQERLDIFITKRLTTDQWSVPVPLGPPVNSNYGENYPCIAANGNLYFFSCRPNGIGGCDLYMSKRLNDGYQKPVLLPPTINSKKHDWDAFIAPDESYIIFSSQERDDSIGAQDLYISFKKPDGAWTQSRNMGEAVNSTDDEICPVVSLDGRYFLFTSRRRGKADIFWMTTAVIKKLKHE